MGISEAVRVGKIDAEVHPFTKLRQSDFIAQIHRFDPRVDETVAAERNNLTMRGERIGLGNDANGMGRSAADNGLRMTLRRNGLAGSSGPAVNGSRSKSGKIVRIEFQSPE
jgi:hypothetical protein